MRTYEYSSPKEIKEKFFYIPEEIILNLDMNEKRTTIFSYFSKRRDLEGEILFSINHIAKWMGKQPNRTANGINNKIIQIIQYLNKEGYLILSEELNNQSIDAVFNIEKVKQKCNGKSFALIYLDELKKIISYQSDDFSNNDVILLVFAYLRMIIYRRKNELSPEEINLDNKKDHEYDIKSRRLMYPDAYNCYYYEIAKKLNLSARIVSKAVAVLNELGLIYSEPLPRIKHEGKWRTDHTIFCNAYKRENSYLLASGEEYYLTEIKNKKKKLKML